MAAYFLKLVDFLASSHQDGNCLIHPPVCLLVPVDHTSITEGSLNTAVRRYGQAGELFTVYPFQGHNLSHYTRIICIFQGLCSDTGKARAYKTYLCQRKSRVCQHQPPPESPMPGY